MATIAVPIIRSLIENFGIALRSYHGNLSVGRRDDRLMPRFSIKELLIATTLIAIGAAMISFVPALFPANPGDARRPWLPFCLIGGFVLIGAGLGTPFQRRQAGAVLFYWLVLIIWSLFLFL